MVLSVSRVTFREVFLQRGCGVQPMASTIGEVRRLDASRFGIHPADERLLFFAGLYESWQAKPGDLQWTFTIITTQANGRIKSVHDRMPIILDEQTAEDWMNPNEAQPIRLRSLLVPAPEEKLVITPASASVNSVKNDGPELLDVQVTPCRQFAIPMI